MGDMEKRAMAFGDSVTPEEEKWLDERLATPAQDAIRTAVQALPEETVSLAWRSELNEKLLAMAPPRRKSLLSWRPLAGLAVAGALAVMVIVNAPEEQSNGATAVKPSMGNLISMHRRSVAQTEIAGPGLNANELEQETVTLPAGNDWGEADLDVL